MDPELSLIKYFGVDWLAMLLTFAAIYLLGNKSRIGFPTMMCGNACWIAIGVFSGSIAMVLANFGFLVMNVRGWIKWSGQETE